MRTQRAVVLEKSGTVCTVLTADGSFRRVRRFSTAEAGEEIEIKEGLSGLRQEWGSFPAWATAAVLLFFVLTGIWRFGLSRPEVPVAFLSVDINPSMELGLDAQDQVLQIKAVNQDAQTLLKGLPYKGQSSQAVLDEIVTKAVSLHFLNQEHSWVLLGLVPAAGGDQNLTGFDLSGLVGHVATEMSGQATAVHVAGYKLTGAQQKQAQAEGLTPGQYALWLNARKAGFDLSAHALSDPVERDRLLSEPKVQAEINSSGGIFRLGHEKPAQAQGKDEVTGGAKKGVEGQGTSAQGRNGSSAQAGETRPKGAVVPPEDKGKGAKGADSSARQKTGNSYAEGARRSQETNKGSTEQDKRTGDKKEHAGGHAGMAPSDN